MVRGDAAQQRAVERLARVEEALAPRDLVDLLLRQLRLARGDEGEAGVDVLQLVQLGARRLQRLQDLLLVVVRVIVLLRTTSVANT